MRILVFAAHPDDEVIGVGGTLLKRKREGHETAVCYFTKAVKERNSARQIKEKEREAVRAGKALGLCRQFFLGYPAGRTERSGTEAVLADIRRVVKAFSPEVIYTHYPHDLHSDHRVLSEAVLIATRPGNFRFLEQLYFYNEVTASTFWSLPGHLFRPDVFVDISGVMAAKVEAFSCYESQARSASSPRSAAFLGEAARYHGRLIGVEYAETFQLGYHCERGRGR